MIDKRRRVRDGRAGLARPASGDTGGRDARREAGNRLENLWDPARAAGMSEPELLLYRSNLLGADKRITNYGGGNTSAKVMREGPADRRDGRGALGQGLGRRRRHDQARRLRHALHGEARGAEGALPRRRRTRTRWWATCPTAPSTSTRAPPRSTRRCTPTCRAPHVDHMHADAIIAIAASKDSQRADPGGLRRRDRLAAVEAAGLRARALAREVLPREPGGEGRGAREPRALHLGRRRAGAATTTTIEVINRAIDWLDERTAGKPAFGGAAAHGAASRPSGGGWRRR